MRSFARLIFSIQEVGDVRLVFHRREIWRMDEDELVEAGRKMVALEHSRVCYDVSLFLLLSLCQILFVNFIYLLIRSSPPRTGRSGSTSPWRGRPSLTTCGS